MNGGDDAVEDAEDDDEEDVVESVDKSLSLIQTVRRIEDLDVI